MAYTKSILSPYDSFTGLTQIHHYDADTDHSVFETVGDATPVLEFNRMIANDPEVWKRGMKADFCLYAKIPPIVQMKLLTEKGIDIYKKEHGNRLSKVLEDPDYRYLKTTSKRHIIKAYD
jgi:hypothetical protein